MPPRGSLSQSCQPPLYPPFPQGPKSACPGEAGDPGCRSDAPGSPGCRPQEWGSLVPPWHRGPILGGTVQGLAALGFLSPSCWGSCWLGGGWQITACSGARALSRVRPTVCPAAGTVLRDPIPRKESAGGQEARLWCRPGAWEGCGRPVAAPAACHVFQRVVSKGWDRTAAQGGGASRGAGRWLRSGGQGGGPKARWGP